MPESVPITRRETLAALGAAGLAGCLEAPATTTEIPDRLTVGVLQPLSTPGRAYGEQGLSGFLTGLAYETDGEPGPLEPGEYGYTLAATDADAEDTAIDVRVRDTEFTATTAVDQASELVTQEGADVLYGIANAGGVASVREAVVTEFDVPLIVSPAGSAALTREAGQCHPQVFRTTAHAGMAARAGAAYLADGDVDRIGLVVTDGEFGETVRDAYRAAAAGEEGGTVEIVGEQTVATDAETVDWARVLERAGETDPEVVVAGVTDAGVAALTERTLREQPSFGLQASFGSGPGLRELAAAVEDPGAVSGAVGPFVSRYHWNQYDNPVNDAFIERHESAYGELPDLFTAGSFVAASALVQALETAAPTAGEVAETLRGMTVAETPKGPEAYAFRRRDNQARSPVTIAPLAATDEPGAPAAVGPGEPVARIAGDRALPEAEQSCDLR